MLGIIFICILDELRGRLKKPLKITLEINQPMRLTLRVFTLSKKGVFTNLPLLSEHTYKIAQLLI